MFASEGKREREKSDSEIKTTSSEREQKIDAEEDLLCCVGICLSAVAVHIFR